MAGQGSRPLPSWCSNRGTVTDEAKIALLGSADVFVAPQLARESFGIVLLEAMASGVQIVASDLPPFVDLLGAPRTNRDSAKSSPRATTGRSPVQCSRSSTALTHGGQPGRNRQPGATTGRVSA